ncbi:MAG TPA: CHASE2 domain-containing protein [Terriglobales bacterium]
MSFARRHNSEELLLLSLMLFLISAILCSSQLAREIDSRVRDGYVRLQPRSEPPSDIALVLIDDRSLQEYGRWPWSRELLARLVNKVNDAHPRVVGVDILLSEAESKTADRALADSFRTAPPTVLVAKIGAFPDGPRWITPLPIFTQRASVAHAQAVLDTDGLCRRFPIQEVSTDGVRYALGVELARKLNEVSAAEYLRQYGLDFEAQNRPITVAKPTLAPIAYRRTDFFTLSAADVLRHEHLYSFANRAVLIGFGPSEISDRLTTPLGGPLPTPGVEINAQILNAVLHGLYLHELPQWWSVAIVLVIAPALVYCFRRVRGWQSPIVALALALGAYFCGYLLFRYASISVSPLPIIASTFLAPLLVYAADFVIAERRLSAQLRGMQAWLDGNSAADSRTDTNDIFGQLSALDDLQAQLGSLYELHDRLLESTDDAVVVFDSEGKLLLQNRRFADLFPQPMLPLTLRELERKLQSDSHTAVESSHEVSIREDLYAVRISPLPSVNLAKGGGTVVTLSSLRMRVERDRARAQAIRFVTHELRTPIVAIQGFAELMMDMPGSPACERAPETIFRESQRLIVLINSYLDVLRIESGFAALRRESVDVSELVSSTTELLGPLAQAAHMKVSFHQHAQSCISGDKTLLTGAVLNLVSNAIKYGRSGTEVEITSVVEDSDVVLSVFNECTPLPESELQALFEMNYRSASNSWQQQGWGIGLTFVKRIAENHGGSVHAENAGNGVRFELRLPAAPVEAPASEKTNA